MSLKLRDNLFLILLFISLSAQSNNDVVISGTVYWDKNNNGIQNKTEMGLADIPVSNGIDMVLTDASGKYKIKAMGRFVFIIKPAGFDVNKGTDKLPGFYHEIKTGANYDFALHTDIVNKNLHVALLGDPQVDATDDINHFQNLVIKEMYKNKPDMAITLGDLCFDNQKIYPELKEAMGLLEAPLYNCMGNHDMNYDAKSNDDSFEGYEKAFGPAVYSFNKGAAHFIALDDVFYIGNKNYEGRLSEQVLTYVRNDLRLVKADQLLVLYMHIPIDDMENRDALFEILRPYKHVLCIAAHTHTNYQVFYNRSNGWKGENELHLLVAGATCGSWWQGEHDMLGIPQASMHCGSPKGYWWLDISGYQYKLTFKATQFSKDYQMNIWAPEKRYDYDTTRNMSKLVQRDKILINVFSGSEKTKVAMKIDNDSQWITLRKADQPDPYYTYATELQKQGIYPTKISSGYGEPEKARISTHIWEAKIPSAIEPGLHKVTVRVNDPYHAEFIDYKVFYKH